MDRTPASPGGALAVTTHVYELAPATVLFVDQVGSTAMLTELGEAKGLRIRERLLTVLDRAVVEHGSSATTDTGDGLKAIFDTPFAAVSCALDIRRQLYRVNRGTPADERIQIRVGIHTGDMPHRLGEPDGIGVAQAARLCALAARGQILVSTEVKSAIEELGHAGAVAEFASIGAHRLKGIALPVEVYRMYRPVDRSGSSIPSEILELHYDSMVGRDHELDVLRSHLDALLEPHTGTGPKESTVVIRASPGMGKRRLVLRFAYEVVELGLTVRWVTEHLGSAIEHCDVLVPGTGSSASTISRLRILIEDDPQAIHTDVPTVSLAPLDNADVEFMVRVTTGGSKLDARISAGIADAAGHPGKIRALLEQQRAVDSTRRTRDMITAATIDQSSLARSLAGVANDVHERVVDTTTADDPDRAPYMGLGRFEAIDAALFCGRDELIAVVISRLAVHGFVMVSGASGSGKSSLLRAGVLPALAHGALPLSHEWATVVMVPGTAPLTSLALALQPHLAEETETTVLADRLGTDPSLLADLAAERRDGAHHGMLLVVDQAEELFTIADEAERRAFADLLTDAAARAGESIRLVLVMRSDFYGRLATFGSLAVYCAEHLVVVPEMSRQELETAVVEPARRAGLALEPDLVERVVDEVGGHAGALPLVSTAMLETWRRRDRQMLTIAGFDAAGGVHGSVSQLAENIYESLDPESRALAERVLTSLTEPGRAESETARSVPLAEVKLLDPRAGDLIEELTNGRLLTIRGDDVELSHEALISAWPRLATWLDRNRSVRRTRRLLDSDSSRWSLADRPDDLLYRPGPLEVARSAVAATTPALSEIEVDFLAASIRIQAEEEAAAQRNTRRLRVLVSALAVALFAAIAAGSLATIQRRDARALTTQALISQTAELSQSIGAERPDLAFLLAVESLHTGDSTDGRRAALSASSRLAPPNRQLVRAAGDPVRATSSRLFTAMFDRQSRTVMLGTADGTTELVDITTGGLAGEPRAVFGDAGVRAIAMTNDGHVAVLSTLGELSIREPGSDLATPIELNGFGTALGLASAGDRFLAGTSTGALLVFDTAGVSERLAVGSEPVRHVITSSDSVAVVGFEDGSVSVVDADGARTVTEVQLQSAPISALAISPDGSLVASAADDRSLWIWKTADGAVVAGPIEATTREIRSLAFNDEGTLLAAGASDETVRVFDVALGTEVVDALNELTDNVIGVVFEAPSGDLLAVSEEGDVMRWSVEAAPRFEEPRALTTDMAEVRNLTFSSDGALLIAVGNDGVADGRRDIMDGPNEGDPGRISVYETATGELLREMAGHDAAVNWVEVHPDGLVATASHDGTVRAWDPLTGAEMGAPLRGHDGPVLGLAFDPSDPDHLVSAGADGTIRRWSWERREEIGQPIAAHDLEPDLAEGPTPILRQDVIAVSFNSDGSLLASAGVDYTARIHDTTDWSTIAVLKGHEGRVRDVVFDALRPDVVHTASFDKTLASWDITTGKRLTTSEGHTFLVIDLLALPDGTALISSSWDNTIRFWNPETGESIGAPLGRHRALLWRMALSPDANMLATAGQDGTILLWNQIGLGYDDLVERACARASLREEGPNLTEAEWQRYVGPAKEYRTPCG